MSLTRQRTSVPYEVIVIDNNSTDNTSAIATSFGFRVVREPTRGRSESRNAGIHAARGTTLAFTEADCIVPPGWIQETHDVFAAHKRLIGVTGGIRFIRPNNAVERYGPNIFLLGNLLYRILLGNPILRGTSCAIRKSAVDRIGLFSSRASPLDDIEYGMRAAKAGPILYTDTLTVQTYPRRIRRRIGAYLREYITAYAKIFFLKQPGNDRWFGNIRNY